MITKSFFFSLTSKNIYANMYLARNLAYNKKGHI